MSTLTLLLSTTLAFAPTAEAADPAPAAEMNDQNADDAARTNTEGDTSYYSFADDELTGEHLSPDGTLIPWRRPPAHPSLINLRAHFMPELVRLALDV